MQQQDQISRLTGATSAPNLAQHHHYPQQSFPMATQTYVPSSPQHGSFPAVTPQVGGSSSSRVATVPNNESHSNNKRGRGDSHSTTPHNYSEAESDAENNMTVVTMEPGEAVVQQQAQQQQHHHQHPPPPPPMMIIPGESSSKRSRSNNYTSPKEIPKNSLISAMGSLVVPPAPASQAAFARSSSTGTFPMNFNPGNPMATATTAGGRQVPLRRQLSGGRIERFVAWGTSNNNSSSGTLSSPNLPSSNTSNNTNNNNSNSMMMDVELPSRPRSMSL